MPKCIFPFCCSRRYKRFAEAVSSLNKYIPCKNLHLSPSDRKISRFSTPRLNTWYIFPCSNFILRIYVSLARQRCATWPGQVYLNLLDNLAQSTLKLLRIVWKKKQGVPHVLAILPFARFGNLHILISFLTLPQIEKIGPASASHSFCCKRGWHCIGFWHNSGLSNLAN